MIDRKQSTKAKRSHTSQRRSNAERSGSALDITQASILFFSLRAGRHDLRTGRISRLNS